MASFGAKFPNFSPIKGEPENELPTYSGATVLGRLIKADLSVTLASGKLFADDGMAESVDEFSSATITMETDDMTNSDGKDPIDYDAIMKNPAEFYMPATDAVTGTATYFSKYDIVRDDYRTLMATCALPGFCRPVQVNHHYYYDGGVADSIPVQHALDDGCNKLVVILSNPRDFVKQPEAHRPIYKRMLHKYPKTIEGIDHRHINYQASIDLTAKLEKEGKAFVFAPSKHLNLGTFSKDAALEQKLYDLGVSDYETQSGKLLAFLQK